MSSLLNVAKLRFHDGTELSLTPSSIVVFVGPNNAGKSQVLRDIRELARGETSGTVLAAAELVFERDADAFRDWMKDNLRQERNSSMRLLSGLGGSLDPSFLGRNISWPPENKYARSQIVDQLLHLTDCEDRLLIAKATKSIDFLLDPLTSPIHELQRNWEAWRQVSDLTYKAFGKHLTIDVLGGPQWSLRVTDERPPADNEQLSIPNPKEHLAWRQLRPRIDIQGDGIRAFVGCLLHALAVDWSATLIDEPEAFLHPPQSRLLGRVLAEVTPPGRQLMVATHSTDFVRGLMDAGVSSRLALVRLERVDQRTSAYVVDSEAVARTWTQPLFMFSNLIDGLFHDGVIICEADSDCRFYAAVASVPDASSSPVRVPDVLWTWSGGTSRIPSMIDALRLAHVPVRVIVDFDVIGEETKLDDICMSMGIDVSQIANDCRILREAVNVSMSVPSLEKTRENIADIFRPLTGRFLSEVAAKSVREAVKYASPWASAKKSGGKGLPQGPATAAWSRIRDVAARGGLFIVPVGELERFAPEIDGHGPTWVRAVLERYDLANAPQLGEARDFAGAVMNSLGVLQVSATSSPIGRPRQLANAQTPKRANDLVPSSPSESHHAKSQEAGHGRAILSSPDTSSSQSLPSVVPVRARASWRPRLVLLAVVCAGIVITLILNILSR